MLFAFVKRRGTKPQGKRLLTRNGWSLLLIFSCAVTSAEAQTTDTLYSTRPVISVGNAALVIGFGLATLAATPADRRITRALQDEARQANKYLNRGAAVFRLLGHPGGIITGAGIYAGGYVAGNRRAEDLGLHTVETIVIANTITAAIKMTAGRARPRESPDNAANFKLFRGVGKGEYQSFPSGHTTAAFAFATIVSAETSHWWPESRWLIGPVVYGGAALTGVSRIYNNAHWASDVVAGAAVGTLTGIKVYRYQHSHPNNRLDKRFLRAGLQVSNTGSLTPIMSMVAR